MRDNAAGNKLQQNASTFRMETGRNHENEIHVSMDRNEHAFRCSLQFHSTALCENQCVREEYNCIKEKLSTISTRYDLVKERS